MRVRFGRFMRLTFLSAVCVSLLAASPAFAAKSKTPGSGSKTKIEGVVVSRDGNVVTVKEQKSGSDQAVQVTDATKIQRGHKTMGVNALVPGLKIKVKGIKTEEGQIEAKQVHLKPNAFDITVAQQQQILDNKAAAAHAQASADEGIGRAGTAQSSADQAQSTANQGLSTAQTASTMASANTAAVGALDQRVSQLDDYNSVAELPVHFRNGSARLDKASQAALDEFIAANSNRSSYLVEVAGYSSSTGSKQFNQRLSDKRAEAVVQYLREKANVPAWRIVTPAGYGESHPLADNSDANGRAMNRRVEVKVLVSKAVEQSAPLVSSAANQ